MLRNLLARLQRPGERLSPVLVLVGVLLGLQYLGQRAQALAADADFQDDRLRQLVPLYHDTVDAYRALRSKIEWNDADVSAPGIPDDETLERLDERLSQAPIAWDAGEVEP